MGLFTRVRIEETGEWLQFKTGRDSMDKWSYRQDEKVDPKTVSDDVYHGILEEGDNIDRRTFLVAVKDSKFVDIVEHIHEEDWAIFRKDGPLRKKLDELAEKHDIELKGW